jgi:hypothetical protein
MLEMPVHLETMRPWYCEWVTRYYAHTVDNLRAGKRDGTIRPDLDHTREAERFVAYGTGLCFLWSLDWDGYDMAAALAEWRDHLERSYRA